MNHEQRMQLRHAAIDKLADHGVHIARTSTMVKILPHVEKVTGIDKRSKQMISDYLYGWVDARKTAVNPPYRPAFRPLQTKPHPRMDDIERSQPPFMTPRGAIGNGSEHSQVWRR